MKTESGRQRIQRAAERPASRPREVPPGAMVPQTPPGKPPNSEADSEEFLNRAFDDEDFADETMGSQADEELHLLGHVASSRTPDIAEIHSPPRVTKEIKTGRWKHVALGFAFDLTLFDFLLIF